MIRSFLLVFVCIVFIGCENRTCITERATKINPDTFQVRLVDDDAVGLPSLLVFSDESPLEAARIRGTNKKTIAEVIRSRYSQKEYEIVDVVRIGRWYTVSLKRTK